MKGIKRYFIVYPDNRNSKTRLKEMSSLSKLVLMERTEQQGFCKIQVCRMIYNLLGIICKAVSHKSRSLNLKISVHHRIGWWRNIRTENIQALLYNYYYYYFDHEVGWRKVIQHIYLLLQQARRTYVVHRLYVIYLWILFASLCFVLCFHKLWWCVC